MTVIPVNNKKKKTASASLDNNAAETQLFKVKTKQEMIILLMNWTLSHCSILMRKNENKEHKFAFLLNITQASFMKYIFQKLLNRSKA